MPGKKYASSLSEHQSLDIMTNTITDLSWIEITKLVPSLFMRFDIELADPENEPEQHCWLVIYTWASCFDI